MIDLRKLACISAAGFIGTVLIASAAVPVHAAPQRSGLTVTGHRDDSLIERVGYGDLSLATTAGQRMLVHRVGAAVHRVCPDADENGGELDFQACEQFAWDGARPQIDRAVHAALSGAPMAMSIAVVGGQ